MRHAWFVVPQCRPLNSRGLKCWLQLVCHRVIWRSIMSRNTKQLAVGKLKMIKHVLQMSGYPCSSLLALDLSSLISFRKWKRIGTLPHWKRVERHAMPNFDQYSKQWPTSLWVWSLKTIHTKINWLYFVTAIASKLHQQSMHISSGKGY